MLAYTAFVHQRMKLWLADLEFVISQLHDLASELGRLAACLGLDGCHYGMPSDA